MIDNLNNDITWVCKYYPTFKHLKGIAKTEINMKVSLVNILRQSSDESNGKIDSLFNYHIDLKLERMNIQACGIFMITYTKLTMQMIPDTHPCKKYKYK